MEDDFADLGKDQNSDEDEEIDDYKHNRLLDAISSLDGRKRTKKVERTEPATKVSEFHVISSGDKVKLHELVGALKDSTRHGDLKKRLNRIQKKKKVLATPLSKHEQDKIQRIIAYEQTTKEVSKWDPVVEKHRTAEHLSFPLQKPDVRLHKIDDLAKRIQPYTSLEMEVAAVLNSNKNVLLENRVLTPEEEKALKAMSLEEAKERRAELQKYRALLSYKESKARRQNKIKSKKYHKVLRKEKAKKEKKRLEELEKTDPELFLEELNKMEKDRVQERISLKHRGGSKFMQRQKLYAKYDDKARQSVQDMIDKNKDLTRKMATESSSDEDEDGYAEEDAEADLITPAHMSQSNPWLAVPGIKPHRRQAQTSSPDRDRQSEYSLPKALKNTQKTPKQNDIQSKPTPLTAKSTKQKVQVEGVDEEHADSSSEDEVNMDNLFDTLEALQKIKGRQAASKLTETDETEKKTKKKGIMPYKDKKQVESDINESSGEEYNVENEKEVQYSQTEELISVSLSRKRTLADMEGNWSDEEVVPKKATQSVANTSVKMSHKPTEVQVDPKKFMTVETSLKSTKQPHLVDDEDADTEEQHRMTISEAFASDDVVEEFNAEKKDLEDKEKIKDIDLTLPGWGEWGGAGLQASKRKKKRFTIKAPQAPPRRDRGLNNVIISEAKDNTISKHQVNQLPHYFKSVHQFESSVRAPIGKTWNPETAYKDLIKPKVKTQIGAIIEPINKAEVFKKQQVKGEFKSKPKNSSNSHKLKKK